MDSAVGTFHRLAAVATEEIHRLAAVATEEIHRLAAVATGGATSTSAQ
ncbi:MAG: hypothetical protein IT423_03065 [Pirellulaceae bacterium]|nr:hypothetical protein [Pirellulaceae bacterium]